MDFAVPPDDGPLDPMWWAPLEQVARTVTGTRRHRFFDIDDFMLMVRLVRRDRPDLTVYKHRFTRRSLHLADDAGPYRSSAPRRLDRPGRHIRARSLDDVLDHLCLWELPWMKDELRSVPAGPLVGRPVDAAPGRRGRRGLRTRAWTTVARVAGDAICGSCDRVPRTSPAPPPTLGDRRPSFDGQPGAVERGEGAGTRAGGWSDPRR